jgi:hypothetical protein
MSMFEGKEEEPRNESKQSPTATTSNCACGDPDCGPGNNLCDGILLKAIKLTPSEYEELTEKARALDVLERMKGALVKLTYGASKGGEWGVVDILGQVYEGHSLLETMQKVADQDPSPIEKITAAEAPARAGAFEPQTQEARQETIASFVDEMKAIMAGKGHDYTGGGKDVDLLQNFRLVYDLLKGCQFTPYTIAMVYKLKHLCSELTFARTGRQESGEPLRGRHLDDANYSYLQDQLVEDHRAVLNEKGGKP